MSLFAGPGPRWFTVPAHRPFVDDLARGLLDELGADDPLKLADAVVLTPTRRAARALVDAFLRAAADRPLLPPQVRALGDLEEGEPPFEPGDLGLDLPPAISTHQRRFELARMVAEHEGRLGRDLDAGAALDLADALAGFLDSAAIEEVELEGRLDGLTDGDHAEHWRRSAEFLRIAVEAWPRRLAELGLQDVAARRVALLRALGEQWTARPPEGVLVAAGSTGTVPATSALLQVIAGAPQGCVVLPGLDQNLAEEAWAAVDPQHPQGALKRLLQRAETPREAVRVWPASPESTPGRARRRLVNEALRPAEATADWLRQVSELRAEGGEGGADPIAEGLKGMALATARDEDAAAAAIALLLRETLESPDRTAALVTPDAALGRRVAARLSRWGVVPDSSVGAPLATTPVGVLVALTAGLMDAQVDPVAALAVLKHPLVRLGRDREALRSETSTLERYALRGARPRDWSAVRDRLETVGEGRRDRALERGEPAEAAAELLHRYTVAADLVDDLEEALVAAHLPFQDGDAGAPAAVRAHVELLEVLAADAQERTGDLWAGPDGEAAARLFAALLVETEALPPVTASGYAELVERLLRTETVRTAEATHPRLRILGAIEARLVRSDRLVLAGLEEGVWPVVPPTDPFLSRPMRERLGLPPPERRIGLSAHDFAQASCAPEVFLVHTERRGGQPTVKSRWLWRLETLLRGAGLSLPRAEGVEALARALDQPGPLAPAKRPEPRPPVDARPKKLSVTRVETWVRDPYALYAEYVLGLEALPRPGERVGPRERGTALHAAFERFALRHPGPLDADAHDRFAELMIEALREAGVTEPDMARETTLARNAAVWAAEMERTRRSGCHRLVVEQRAELELPELGFTLTAKTDRLEISDCGHVIDFKTGAPPSRKQVEQGLAPQLTLTAAILAAGGFKEVGPIPPGELLYIKITGRKEPGQIVCVASRDESPAMAAQALGRLQRLVARYQDPNTPFTSRLRPKLERERGGDYDGLARVWEWDVLAGAEDAEAEA